MTRHLPLWLQSERYPAEQDRWLFGAIWPDGGASGAVPFAQNNSMNVQFTATPSQPGLCVVRMGGGNGGALCRWDQSEVVTLNPAPPANQSRIDIVTCMVRDSATGGQDNDWIFYVFVGAPTIGVPVAPAVPQFGYYPMCSVLVPGGAANLNGATIRDLRVPLTGANFRAGIYRSNNWSLTSAQTVLPFNTSEPDSVLSMVSGLNTNQARLIAPIRGRYLAASAYGVTPPATTHIAYLNLRRNGVVMQGAAIPVIGGQWGHGPSATRPMVMEAGDYVDALVNHNGSVNFTGATGIGATWLTLDYLGPAP
jgi:hypothetical protein